MPAPSPGGTVRAVPPSVEQSRRTSRAARKQAPTRDYRVAAVDRALALLMLVSEQPGLGVSDLARRSGSTKARTFRLLQTLEAAGLIGRDDDGPVYRLGYQAACLGSRARQQVDLIRLAEPMLAEIGQRCEETVQLRIRRGKASICVARWEPEKIVRFHAEVGKVNVLYAGAGKLLLAHAPASLQHDVLAGRLLRFTPNTPVDIERLQHELARIREQGYCISQRETDPDAVSAGAPVRDAWHAVVAAFIIGAPASRTTKGRLAELAKLAMQGAASVSRALGWPGA